MRMISMHHVLQIERDGRQPPVDSRMKRKRALLPGQHLGQRIDHLLEHRLRVSASRCAGALAQQHRPQRFGALAVVHALPGQRGVERVRRDDPALDQRLAEALHAGRRRAGHLTAHQPDDRGAAPGRDHERAGLVLQAQELEHLGQREAS